jgi:FlaA1/EpsC-like NDP-sugar epimerase
VGLRPEKKYEELLNDTSKTIPTHHQKIMIAEEITEEYVNLHCDIERLLQSATQYNNEETVALMKKIVPSLLV